MITAVWAIVRLDAGSIVTSGNHRSNPAPRPASRPGPTNFSALSKRQSRITATRRDLGTITLRPMANKAENALWRELIARWHYLGHRLHGGAQIRYLAWDAQGRLLAAMEFSASE